MCRKRKVGCEKQEDQREDLHAVSPVQSFPGEIGSRHVLCHFVADDCYDLDLHETEMDLHACTSVPSRASLAK